MSAIRGKQGRQGNKGLKGDAGVCGDTGYSDINEVMTYLKDIKDTQKDMKDTQEKQTGVLGNHTTDLAVIKEQVKITNGTLKTHNGEINVLFKLNNESEKRLAILQSVPAEIENLKTQNGKENEKWAGLQGSLNAWKYLSYVLGALFTLMGIYAYLKP